MGEGTQPTESGAQSHIIKRPRLTKLLDDSGARLVLLVAPAGYGTTTLARQWLAAYHRPVAWYRATPASADVAALATGLAAEIDAAIADGETSSSDRLTPLAAVQQRPDILARALSRSREEWPRRLVIAIDDYHQISCSDAAETFVGELVSLLPATFVITTRTRPTWCTPRQAVYGEAVEVGTAELTMTEDEARQVFEASSGRSPRASTLEIAHGWPVVIGLAARSDRIDFPSRALPRNLYEFLAEDLINATTPETQHALSVLALTGTNERTLICELVGADADVAISEAERRGLLSSESSSQIVLHPLLGEFLIERLRGSPRESTEAIVDQLVCALMKTRHWDECLAIAEALPNSCAFASATLEHSLEEQLNTGRVATVRRWVALARHADLDDPIVELAEAEVALLGGEFERALAVGSHVAGRRTSRDVRSRAELVAGRAAHLADQRSVAMDWFRAAEVSARSRHVRAEAVWGQVVIEHDNETGYLESALNRFADANDGTVLHQSRVAHGRVLLGLVNGNVYEAVESAQEAGGLMAQDCNPYARLSLLNQSAWILGYAGRYDEGYEAANRVVAAAEAGGIDFALNHGLLAKARALVGMRRFADARSVLNRVTNQIRLDPVWTAGELSINEARIQISLGDLDRAREILALDLDRRVSVTMHAEHDAYRALVEAARGRPEESLQWVERSYRSVRIEARALAWVTEDIIAFARGGNDPPRLSGVGRVFESGCLDAIIMGCRALPELARCIVIDGSHREALRGLLLSCGDGPLARAAGLEIPRMARPGAELSPRELEVYELMIQGRTNREIGRSLFITESTTKVHVRHILEKLGVRSRVEAVRAWAPALPTESGLDDAS